MSTWVVLLRGINVGGANRLAMADLKEFLTTLTFENPRSLLQSGNLVFTTTSRKSPAALEQFLEQQSEARFAMPVHYLLRSADELRETVAHNPFPAEAKNDPSHLLVMFCKTPPAAPSLQALQRAIKGRERFIARGRELYITYPDGIGPSKFTHGLIEKTLTTRITGRNWNTVLKLAAMLDAK